MAKYYFFFYFSGAKNEINTSGNKTNPDMTDTNYHIIKRLFTTVMLFCGSVSVYSQNNVDFETGTLTGWTGFTGTCCPINANTNGIVAGRHDITSGAGFDAVIGSIPVVSPYGGNYSCRLGNAVTGAQAERLIYTFLVDAANPVLTYHYAVILQDPSHDDDEQPRFQVDIRNAGGQTIPCGYQNYVASGNIPGFQSTGGVVWKNWSLVAIDLTDYIGQNITAEFRTGDCSQGGHYGYAYIDATIGPLVISGRFCPGDNVATLTAPAGFSAYQWSTGQNTQSIVVNNPVEGDTIRVTCTPFQGGAACATVLSFPFERSPIVDVDFEVDAFCGPTNAQLVDASAVATSGGEINEWKWFVNNVLVGTDSTFDYNFSGPGNYDITLISASTSGCPDTLTKTVTVPLGLSATTVLPAGFGVSCFDSQDGYAVARVQSGNPPYTFDWNNGAYSTDSIYNLAPGDYTVAITDSAGCQIFDTVTITVPPPIVIAPAAADAICYGEPSGKIWLNASGGVPPYTYTWSPNVSTLDSATAILAGTYSFTVTDSKGCVFDSSITISEPPQYQITHTHTDAICYGSSDGTITITSVTGNTPGYTYAWNTNPVQTADSAIGLSFGPYTCTITDVNGCITTVSQQVSQPSLLTVNLPKTDVRCYGDSSGSITAIAMGSVPPYVYAWSTGDTVVAIPNIPIGTYSLTVTDDHLCTVSASIVITEPPVLTVSASSYDEKCFGDSSARAFSVAAGGVTPYNYVWNASPLQTQPNAINLKVGTYIITVTDNNGCVATDSTVISEPSLLTASVTDTVDNVCFNGNAGSLTVTATGGSPQYYYLWNSAPQQFSATASQLPASEYHVTVTDDSACVAYASATVKEPTQLTATYLAEPALCYDSTQGKIQIYANNGTPGYTYTWNPNVSIADSAVNLLSGSYDVTITDANGCTLVLSDIIVAQPPQLFIETEHTNPECYGYSVGTISVDGAGGTPMYHYSIWQSDTVVATNDNGMFSGLNAGTYVAQYADENNCVIKQDVIITQPSALEVQITPKPANCYGYSDGSIVVLASNGTAPYLYVLDTITQNSWGFFYNLRAGTYPVRVYDNNGCFVDTSAIVEQPTYVIVVSDPDSLVLFMGESKSITLSSNYGSNIQYKWTPTEGLDCTTCDVVKVSLSKSSYYEVQGIVHPYDLDCIVEVGNIPVTVIPKYNVYIPNAFTPNGNGANDYYEIFGAKSTWLEMRFRIFNRWGEKVFESADPYFKWDGVFKGIQLAPNVYVYELELTFLDGHSIPPQKGSITLIR